jgi:Spy/CpxP family protein refolding chaperone
MIKMKEHSMKHNMLFVSFTALVLSVGMLIAGPKRGGDNPRQMARMLELTESQESQIMDLRLALHKEILPLRTELSNLRSQLKLEITAEDFNENKVSKLASQIADLQKQIRMKRILHQRAVRNLLTEEQKKKFDLHVISRGDHREGRGRRTPRPPRPDKD